MEDSESYEPSVEPEGEPGERVMRPELSRLIPAKDGESVMVKRKARDARKNFIQFRIRFG